jgi:hypothetical protein
MRAQHLLFVAVAMLAGGCGRVGVGLLPEHMPAARVADAGPTAYGGAGAQSDPGLDAGTRAAGDASTSARDAATTTQTDASLAPRPDAAAATAPDAATSLPCGGSRVLGLCWYFSDPETSCNDSCSSRGGFDSRATQYVGTTSQGGSVDACRQILTALGKPGSVVTATRDDNLGLGCHVWTDGTRYWLDDPSPLFMPALVAPPQASVACACAR